MKFLFKACAVAAIALSSPAFANDEDILPVPTDEISVYREVGPWTVYQNDTRASCFITMTDETHGTAVQMGLTKDHMAGYVAVFSKTADVEEGVINDIALIINDNLYAGKSKTFSDPLREGYEGGYVLADKQMRLDLERGKELIAFPDSPRMIVVSLKRSGDAIYEARQCNQSLGS